MEKERLAREKEEQEKVERARKLKEEFGDPNNQWEQDKTNIQNLAREDKEKEARSRPQHAGPDGKQQG